MFLTADDLVSLTHRERAATQRRVLDALGVPYRIHPFDGSLIVARSDVEAWLGNKASVPANDDFVVDVEALARHGKKANEHGR